ncbi:MAG: hypothetical protein C4527_19345 [Candidatus Omnitrophota bacterium]|jgi:hypothetical protein|nr:MAG: hypothetical protein C4527_19345 [Candidatus Omnitrophota bacterium]
MANRELQNELELLFGEESVKLAIVQEILARRYVRENPIKVRRTLEQFQKLKNIEQQKKFVADFDKDMTRAFICSLLCGTASQAVLDLATQAIGDKRSGRAVLGGRILQK